MASVFQDTEIWKPINDLSNYECSNYGNIRNKNKIILKSQLRSGYQRLTLYNNNKKSYTVHRLVAQTFISNPENKPLVNHIDGNPLNNHISNLEWCSHQYNVQHAHNNKLCENRKMRAVLQFTLNEKFIKEYKSLIYASTQTNTNKVSIGRVCMGERKTAGGFKWKYKIDENNYIEDINNKDIWKKIEKYDNYKISIDGRVYNTKKKRLSNISLASKREYLAVSLNKNNMCKRFAIHTLVAKAFISNPKNLPFVNHKDGNKLNNHAFNLEWITQKGNAQHAHDIGLNSSKKAVIQLDKEENEIRRFDSIKEAELYFGCYRSSTIGKVCNGKGLQSCGYRWKYVDNNKITVDKNTNKKRELKTKACA